MLRIPNNKLVQYTVGLSKTRSLVYERLQLQAKLGICPGRDREDRPLFKQKILNCSVVVLIIYINMYVYNNIIISSLLITLLNG